MHVSVYRTASGVVQCAAKGVYPQPRITWLAINTSQYSVMSQNPSLYEITSTLTNVTRGETVTCIVKTSITSMNASLLITGMSLFIFAHCIYRHGIVCVMYCFHRFEIHCTHLPIPGDTLVSSLSQRHQ